MPEGPPSDSRLLSLAIEQLDVPVVICRRDGTLAFHNGAAGAVWPLAGLSAETSIVDLYLFGEDGEPLGVAGAPQFGAGAPLSTAGAPLSTAGAPLSTAGAPDLAAGHPLSAVLAGQERVSARVRADPAGSVWQSVAVALRDGIGEIGGALLTLQAAPDSDVLAQVYASDIEILGEVSRTLAAVEDAAEAAAIVSTVTLGSTGAAAVLLWSVEEDAALRITSEESALDLVTMSAIADQARSGAALAVAETGTQVDRVPTADLTLWHEPLTHGAAVIGVLTVIWSGSFDGEAGLQLLERLQTLIGLLGQQAAVALERAKLLKALSEAARLDALTGLVNRREWGPSLERELKRARRTGEPLSLALLDIDHFKQYNDTHGHPAGDRLLSDAASAWSAQLREVDVLARIGGEEFAALLPGCDLSGAIQVAERLRAAMPHGQTCSIGVCVWDERATVEQLYASADSALYRAKETGRNRVVASPAPERLRRAA